MFEHTPAIRHTPLETENLTSDIAIIGGGITGLWLLNLLGSKGYSVVLVEKDTLGSGQTLASQGMIHGGIKYTLGGGQTGASETIKNMPERWRQCLEGTGTLDLQSVQLLSRDYYMFSDARLSSRVTAFFGSKAVEGRVKPVDRKDYPPVFQTKRFKGLLYRLQDVVIDTESLIRALATPHQNRVVKGDPHIEIAESGSGVITVDGMPPIHSKQVILAAGEGNADLIDQLALPMTMQRRPLHQVIVTGDLPTLYAHAVSLSAGDKPRMTITTHPSENGRTWYLGGQLAETGVARSDTEQILFAKQELSEVFPWIDFSGCVFSTLRINRAEPSQEDGARPDTPFVKAHGNVLICWPTKLTLVPLLGDMVLPLLAQPSVSESTLQAPTAEFGTSPWS